MVLKSTRENSVEYAEEFGRLTAFEDMMDRIELRGCAAAEPGVASEAAARIGLSRKDLMLKNRKPYLNDRRQVVMWYLRVHKHWTYEAIGEIMNRDHSTAVHGVMRVSELISCGDSVMINLTSRIQDGQ